MGGKGGGTTINQPDPVDPYQAANAQLGMNLTTSLANLYGNRIGQVTPYGNLTYETQGYTKIDPKTGQVTQVATPEFQQAMSASDFNRYKNLNDPRAIRGLSPQEREKFDLARSFKDYNDYNNNFTANSAKYLPNQVQRVNLTPAQQRILDLQNAQDIQSAEINQGQMDRVRRTLGQNFDPALNNYNNGGDLKNFVDLNFNGNPNLPGVNDFSADRQKVEDALYKRFDKRFARDEEALRTRLANQGITAGSDAWNAEFENLNQAKNDARNQAILAGGDEQSRLFGLGMQARQQANQEDLQTTLNYNENQNNRFNQAQQKAVFDNQLRGQQMQEALTRRQLPLQEYASLRSGQQIQNPNFQGFYQMNLQGGDIQGGLQNQFDQQMNKYNASVAQKNNAKAGTNDLIKTGAMAGAMAFSDPLLKENIRKVANIRGFNIYKYNFIGTPTEEIGVMADEIAVLRPDCISYDDNGFMQVYYERLFSTPLSEAMN